MLRLESYICGSHRSSAWRPRSHLRATKADAGLDGYGFVTSISTETFRLSIGRIRLCFFPILVSSSMVAAYCWHRSLSALRTWTHLLFLWLTAKAYFLLSSRSALNLYRAEQKKSERASERGTDNLLSPSDIANASSYRRRQHSWRFLRDRRRRGDSLRYRHKTTQKRSVGIGICDLLRSARSFFCSFTRGILVPCCLATKGTSMLFSVGAWDKCLKTITNTTSLFIIVLSDECTPERIRAREREKERETASKRAGKIYPEDAQLFLFFLAKLA